MTKTPTRFSVRKVKCCYRNAMIVGNPIEKTFERFAVYDKGWQYDNFRRLCQTQEEAQKTAAEMNRLWNNCGCPEMIKFNDWGHDVKVEKTEAKCPWNH